MPKRPSTKRLQRKRRFISLRYRFIFITSCLLILLLGTLGSILITHQSLTIRNQLERRGLAISRSLAATSKASLTTYNYIALEQAANQAQRDDPDIVYVIIHDKEGRVAGYSGRADLQGTLPEDRPVGSARCHDPRLSRPNSRSPRRRSGVLKTRA